MKSVKKRRNQKGNMLVLSGTFVTVGAVATLVASSFAGLFFVFNRVQTTADELALAGARKLNELDRVGQMNNMIARSRQLVFDSRQSFEKAEADIPHLKDLSEQLYEEAREGAIDLEQERKFLRNLNQTEVNTAVMDKFNQVKAGHSLVLPWLRVAVPVAPVIRLGYDEGCHSNVAFLDELDELKNHDQSSGFVMNPSKLYKGNLNAKLKNSDTDLAFKLCSLPAPVDNSVAPARVGLAKHFRTSPDDHLQSSVQVELKLSVDTMLGASGHSDVQATGTAVATGGESQQ